MARVQTRRSISVPDASYTKWKAEAEARGIGVSTLVELALGEMSGVFNPPTGYVKPKRGRPRKAPPAPKVVKRSPSIERQMLGDGTANALGFR